MHSGSSTPPDGGLDRGSCSGEFYHFGPHRAIRLAGWPSRILLNHVFVDTLP